MSLHLRVLGLAALGLLGLSAPAGAQTYVGLPPALPGQTIYVPTSNVVTQTTVVRTPIGPTAYVAPPVVTYTSRPVLTTTTTYVPARRVRAVTTYVPTSAAYLPTATGGTLVDPALTPVGYEVVRPGRTKVVYPRRVVRYVY